MVSLRSVAGISVMAGLLGAAPVNAAAQRPGDQEIFNQAKLLMFDKEWEAARTVFLRLIREFPASSVVPEAYFFNARCLQLQGRWKEAMAAYEEFLRRYPSAPVLPAEARSAIVEMAAALFEKGDASYKDRLIAGLADRRKEVRYFTALRCSRLKDRSLDAMVVPVLKEIVASESERELVDRARIALLRIDPAALAQEARPRRPAPDKAPPAAAGSGEKRADTRMLHLEVYEEGGSRPKIELNIPVSLAQLAVAALDESTRQEMRRKGIDVDNVWESLSRMGSADILTIRDGRNVVRIWIR